MIKIAHRLTYEIDSTSEGSILPGGLLIPYPIEIPIFDTKLKMDVIIKGSLDANGFPYIDVGLQNPNNNHHPIHAKAIIDTGGAYCMVKKSIIENLSLNQTNTNIIFQHPLNGIINHKAYYISMYFKILENDNAVIDDLPVGILHLEDYPADMIIGIYFLKKYCRFNYDGLNRTFELHVKG